MKTVRVFGSAMIALALVLTLASAAPQARAAGTTPGLMPDNTPGGDPWVVGAGDPEDGTGSRARPMVFLDFGFPIGFPTVVFCLPPMQAGYWRLARPVQSNGVRAAHASNAENRP